MDKRIIWLATGSFTVSTVGLVYSSLLPSIAADTDMSIPQAGYLIMVFSLAYAIGAPVLSALTGAQDRRHVLVLAILLFVAGNLLAVASTSFPMLFSAQIVMGGAAGLFASAAQATAVMLAGPEHRARAVSLVLAGTTCAVALGAPLGALIAAFWGWRGTFLTVGLLGLVCALILWLRLPRGLRGVQLPLKERFTAIARPGIPSSLCVTLLYLTGGFTVLSYLAPLALDAGLSLLALPAMLLTFGIGAVIGNLASGVLSDRIGATKVVRLSLVVSIAVCLSVAMGIKLLPHDIAGPLLIGIMLPWGIIGWTFPPAQASRIVSYAPQLSHLTLSLNASALYLGVALGTVVGGRVIEFAEPSDIGIVAAAFPLAALVVLAVSRSSRPVPIAAE